MIMQTENKDKKEMIKWILKKIYARPDTLLR